MVSSAIEFFIIFFTIFQYQIKVGIAALLSHSLAVWTIEHTVLKKKNSQIF